MHYGKVGLNTVEYTTAFLYSDWLYFLWHGINGDTKMDGLQGYRNKNPPQKTCHSRLAVDRVYKGSSLCNDISGRGPPGRNNMAFLFKCCGRGLLSSNRVLLRDGVPWCTQT